MCLCTAVSMTGKFADTADDVNLLFGGVGTGVVVKFAFVWTQFKHIAHDGNFSSGSGCKYVQ